MMHKISVSISMSIKLSGTPIKKTWSTRYKLHSLKAYVNIKMTKQNDGLAKMTST